MINELDRLVLQTVAYSSCFNFALQKEEIIARLPFSKKIVFSAKKINNSLQKLINQGIIQSNAGYFYLDAFDLKSRQQRSKHVTQKKIEVTEFVALAAKIPFIKAVVLTGSTAVNNARREDDLDFMLICQRNTLWLSRLLLILLTKSKGKRPLGEASNAWCFNLLLDESDLHLESKRHSFYEAYEIMQMRFVYDRGGMEQAFFNANAWLKNQLFFYRSRKFNKYVTKRSFSALNWFLFVLQKAYRHLIFGREDFSLSLTQAFFNELAFREQVFAKLEKKMQQILLH